MTNTTALATEALNTEGYDAYFPGLDHDSFDAAGVLAAALDARPADWTPAGDDYAWECRIPTADLVAAAVAAGAESA